jgi:hypothetical protein
VIELVFCAENELGGLVAGKKELKILLSAKHFFYSKKSGGCVKSDMPFFLTKGRTFSSSAFAFS